MPRGDGQVMGDTHPFARLTEAAVVRLRRAARARPDRLGRLCTQAAKRHGATPHAVYQAITGITWSCVDRTARPFRLTGAQRQRIRTRSMAQARRGGQAKRERRLRRAFRDPQQAMNAYRRRGP